MPYFTKRRFSQFKSRAKKRGIPCVLTYEQFRYLKQGNCHYCGVEFPLIALYSEKLKINTPYITIDRKDNLGGYEMENCVSSCFVCNRIKGNFFSEEEMKKIGQLFVKPKLEAVQDEVMEEYLDAIDTFSV